MTEIENKQIHDVYNINQDYTLKSVSSDFLQMSCYGYTFDYWYNEEGKQIYRDMDTVKFSKPVTNISAFWKKNQYDVIFWRIKDTASEEIYQLSTVLYKDSVGVPETNPQPPTGMRFNGWVVSPDSKYTLESLSRVSCDMDFIANFVYQYYISFKYKSLGESSESLCTLVVDQGESISHEHGYPSLSYFQKPCYTVSSFIPMQINNVSKTDTVWIDDVENRLFGEFTQSNFTYNGQPHEVKLSSVRKEPYYDTLVDVKYRTSDISWQSEPISFTDVGTYQLSALLSAENYFTKVLEVLVDIVNGQAIKFYFENYYNQSTESFIVKEVLVIPSHPISTEKIPIPDNTISSKFIRWDNQDYIREPTIEHNRVSAIYEIKKFAASYYYDDTITEKSGQLIQEICVDYGENAFLTYPIHEGYVNAGWSTTNSGRDPNTRTMIGESSLSILTQDITCYTFLRKIHDVKLYNVKSDVGGEGEISASNLSACVDYEYIDSSIIGLSNIDNYEFDRWVPERQFYTVREGGQEVTKYGWKVENDNFRISAVFKPLMGELIYHSHYPEDL